MKKLQKIIAVGLSCLMLVSIFSMVGCKSEYDCMTCQDIGEIDCQNCSGGPCPACLARGRDDTRKCDICKGKGMLWDGEDVGSLSDCWRCNGFGTYVCILCNGKGKLPFCEECEDGRIACPDCAKN